MVWHWLVINVTEVWVALNKKHVVRVFFSNRDTYGT